MLARFYWLSSTWVWREFYWQCSLCFQFCLLQAAKKQDLSRRYEPAGCTKYTTQEDLLVKELFAFAHRPITILRIYTQFPCMIVPKSTFIVHSTYEYSHTLWHCQPIKRQKRAILDRDKPQKHFVSESSEVVTEPIKTDVQSWHNQFSMRIITREIVVQS